MNPTTTHPVLVNDVYDGYQLASMRSEGDVGDTADLNEAGEHLSRKQQVYSKTIQFQNKIQHTQRCLSNDNTLDTFTLEKNSNYLYFKDAM